MVDYKTLIDSTELQQKVLDYIASDEFSKMVDSTVFKDNNQCKMAIIHGMAIASMLTCRCEPFCINFKEEGRKHGHWFVLDECANEGVYCSVCSKKVYKLYYANQKLKSKYCPNCGHEEYLGCDQDDLIGTESENLHCPWIPLLKKREDWNKRYRVEPIRE